MGGVPVKSVSVSEASELLSTGEYAYLDVRTPEEFAAGHAPGAVNIPIMLSGPGGLVSCPDFAQQVQEKFAADSALLIGCKAGGRSRQATTVLQGVGYNNVTNIDGGFMAWESKSLPVTK